MNTEPTLPGCHAWRSAFPIALLPVTSDGVRRRCRHARVKRRLAFECNETILGLNWMADGRTVGRSPAPKLHTALAAKIHELHKQFSASCPPTEEASLTTMLQGRSVYDHMDSVTSLAPFELAQVSLPADLSEAPELSDVLPVEARVLLDGELKRMLPRNPEREMDAACFKTYTDPLLTGRRYRQFVRLLQRRGMIRFTLSRRNVVWEDSSSRRKMGV